MHFSVVAFLCLSVCSFAVRFTRKRRFFPFSSGYWDNPHQQPIYWNTLSHKQHRLWHTRNKCSRNIRFTQKKIINWQIYNAVDSVNGYGIITEMVHTKIAIHINKRCIYVFKNTFISPLLFTISSIPAVEIPLVVIAISLAFCCCCLHHILWIARILTACLSIRLDVGKRIQKKKKQYTEDEKRRAFFSAPWHTSTLSKLSYWCVSFALQFRACLNVDCWKRVFNNPNSVYF